MNILFLATHFNTGGISRYILTLAKGLQAEGHRVFVCSSGGDMVADLTELGIGHTTFNIKTKSEVHPKLYLSLFKLSRFIKENKIDLIHAQTRITQVMAVCLKKMTHTPYVSTCHGFFKTRLFRRIFPCWGDSVIAISEAVRDHLINDFKLHPEKVFLISNGIDLEEFGIINSEQREKTRRELRLGNESVIGIIARLSDVKGHDILIKAMKKIVIQIPEAKLLIVGQGKEEGNLKALVKDVSLQRCVQFYSLVNKTVKMLSAFDVFVLPSLQEGLGLSVMEAQAAGLPVVASKVGGIPSLVVDGETGYLVEPGDADGLAEKIVEVLNNRNRSKQVGLCAREFIKENFSSNKMVSATVQVYENAGDKKKSI